MTRFSLSTWPDSRIERALRWFLRVMFGVLLVDALLAGNARHALVFAACLLVHGLFYYFVPRLWPAAWRTWLVTLLDLIVVGLAFYLTLDPQGTSPADFLGYILVAILAARLSLWAALAVNLLLWLLFTFPSLSNWISGGPFPLPIAGNLLTYLALTLIVNYLLSMETRQTRVGHDATSRLQRLSTVHEVGRTISSTLELEAVLDLVMSKAVELLDAEAGSLLLLEPGLDGPGSEALVFHVVLGPAADQLVGQRLPPGEGIAGAVLETGQPALVNRVEGDPRWYEAPDGATGFDTRSILAVPLVSRGRTIGVLEVINKRSGLRMGRRSGLFDDQDLELLTAFASQAAIALENARLYEETNRRLQQVNTLYEVGRSLSTLDTNQVLSTIAQQTVAALGVDLCAVFLHEETRDGSTWTVLKALHDAAGAVGDAVAPDALGARFNLLDHLDLQDQVRGTGYAVLESVETNEQLDETVRRGLGTLGIRTCLLIGLYLHGQFPRGHSQRLGEAEAKHDQARGVLLVGARSETRHFSEDEIELCQALARQATVAVENARLYERTDEALTRRLHELATIEEIDHELGTSLDYERTIDLVLRRAVEACNASSGILGILTSDGAKLEARLWSPAHSQTAGETALVSTAVDWALDHSQGLVGRVVRTGQPALLDVPSEQVSDRNTRSEVAVPIKREERVIGVLNLESDRPAAFGQDDLHFVEHLAEHAGMAIENARLYEETQQRYQQTQLLLRISETIRSSLDLPETVRHVAREMCRALGADMAGVYLAEEDNSFLRAVAGYHVPTDKLEFYRNYLVPVKGHPFIEEAWETRQAVFSLNPADDPRLDPTTVEAYPNKTTLFAPMVARDEVIGGVYLIWEERKHTFSDEELRLANAIVSQAGAVVANSRLFDAQQRQVRELAILFETSAAVSSTLALDEVLRTVAFQMARALDVSSCTISDWDPEEEVVTTVVAEVANPDLVAAATTGDIGESYAIDDYPATAEVLRRRRPQVIRVSDPECDPAERALLEAFEQKSLLMMPLVAHDRVVGLVELYEHRHDRDFTSEDIHLGRTLANQAAIAIEKARLFERTDERLQARVDELTALQRIASELNATLAPDHILQVVLDAAIKTTGASHGSVMLMDLESGQFELRIAQGYTPEEISLVEARLLDAPADSLIAQVAASGNPRIVGDTLSESLTAFVKQETRSALSVPILYESAVVGLINVRQTVTNAFDSHDLSFVQSLAEQAAVAIGNALRFEDQIKANKNLRTRTEQMTSLLEISRNLRADVALEETLEEIAHAIQETIGFNIVLVSLSEGEPAMMRRVAAAGLPLHQFEQIKTIQQPTARFEALYREEYRIGSCYFFPFQKRADWQADLHTIAPMDEIETWQEGQWHPNDMLLVPLQGAGGRLLGQISVDEPRSGLRPSRQLLNVLAIFANQAAIAVENANLYADAERRADDLALINEVGRTMTQVMDPDQVLNTVVRAVIDLLDCEQSAIFLLDPLDDHLVAVASQGVDVAEMRGLRFAPGEGLVGQVAANRAPLLVPDTGVEPHFVPGLAPIGSMLLAPIMVGRQLMGVLTAGSVRPHALSESDQILLTTLADQTAVALESARLFENTQQAAVRLSLLNEIGRRAAAQLELGEMLEMTVMGLHQNLGYSRVAVLLVDAEGEELTVAAANDAFWPVIPADFRLQVGQGIIGAAAASGEPVLVDDTSGDERYVAVGDWHCVASLSVPIRAGQIVIGVLHVEGDRRGAFTEDDAAALSIAADQLAVAIQNVKLLQETRRRVAELATINEIGRAISSALEPSQLYQLIYNQVSNLLDTSNFHIALYHPETEEIHVEFLVEHGQLQESVVLKLGQGLTSYLVRTGEPILLTEGIDQFLQEQGLSLERDPARSWLGVPMIAEDQVIGAVAVQSFDQDHAFDTGHLELLSTIAGQAAVAFQNVMLFQERERRIGELAALNEMARVVSSTLEMDALLETVYKQTSRLMDTTNFYIALYDEEQNEITFPFTVDPDNREDWSPREGGKGLTGRIIESGEPILLPKGAAGLYRESGQMVTAGLCRSWLGVPMIAEDKVMGVIAVQSYARENVFDEQHLNFLMTVASQSAMAVRNAQLYQQIVQFSGELEEMVEARTRDLEKALNELTLERDRVETLYRITSELGATLELERVLQRALQLFADALGVDHGSILLLDQETGRLNLRATLDQDVTLPREGKQTRWRRGVGLAGWIMEHREPVLIADVAEDPRWMRRQDKELKLRSVVAAPLSLGGGDVLGVLTLGHPEAGYFAQEHLQLVTAATAQIAIAVNNSDLYAFITDQADQLGSALQAQQEEAAKNRAILESIADGVLVLDHNGRVLLVNPAAEELLGFAALALEGEHVRHMLGLGETPAHRQLAQELYTAMRKRLEAGDDQEYASEGSIRLQAGNKVLAVNIAPLIVSLGSTPGLVAALRDISREAEVERLKNEFISTVSHELRTPMTSIKGYTDLLFLGMAGGLTDAQRNFLQIIKSNADRLTALVNDILDISRIETGRIRLTIEELDLGDIIEQVVVSFKEQYREKGLELLWQRPEDLPEVRGDAARVTQILSNLVANAWHYTKEGSVTVSTQTVGGFVQVNVSDTGIGIMPEDLDRIWDRFYRVDHPVVQEAGGTGLGLSIVRMFVEMLGGEIWVESTMGEGSTFSFTMPLPSTDVPEPSVDLLTTEPTPVVSRRPKILVVEDNREVALQLRRQLETDGYQVVLAGSGEDALWLAREEQPQLITLDIMLPDVDGFDVLERLKAHPSTTAIPVVVTSVLAESEKGFAMGAVDYVVKPFSEKKLLEAVRQALAAVEKVEPQKLLVVDDDPDIRALMSEALAFHGYQIFTAVNGREALDQVPECEPDLILLDLKMPGIDGYEVIRRLKGQEATRSIPIIVITASPVDKDRDRIRVLGMGATQYITKPLSIESLVREIKKAIAENQPA